MGLFASNTYSANGVSQLTVQLTDSLERYALCTTRMNHCYATIELSQSCEMSFQGSADVVAS